ncbi:thiolase family protein [Staphylococcus sp. ACRSN]|uniref:thiolase family protein n=1 Tax=Staphylococcus sp. ACRSN TaxID=2918214 RepID=UPI001EF24C31|nr:thiolase family protein [Staphylococcus sp. ACRSN]MCG7339306.1 thiolase family protein [Staphylococcus sp. ACRSN]
MREPVIIAAKRTAFGKFGGQLRHLEPEYLLLPLFHYFKQNYPSVMKDIDDVVLGNVVGNGGNIARKALLEAGLNEEIPGVTIDRQCGSGLEAIIYACRMIQAGSGEIYIAGGVESTSRSPWKIKRPQSVYDFQVPEFFERASFAPEHEDPSMIEAAEQVANVYNVTRQQQDHFAYASHQKAVIAYEQGQMAREILPISVKGQLFEKDESLKPKLTERTLNRFKPLLPDGTVTVGNSCMKNDGAALVIVMERELAERTGLTSGLIFKQSMTKGVSPNVLGIGPIPAVTELLQRTQFSMEDIDAIEINEAFASQVIASQLALNVPDEKLNILGGALATGHPYGASGAALVTRLFHLESKKHMLATMGIGGGMGNAALFERW